MSVSLTVLTPTIPGREDLLKACLRSVYEQRLPVEAHLVMAQPPIPGMSPQLHCARQQTQLLAAVQTDWCMRLADDDSLLPHHVETLWPHTADADVLYSWDANNNRPRVDVGAWSQAALVDYFTHSNCIDGSAVLTRTDLVRSVGGWPTEWEGPASLWDGGHFAGMRADCDDWALWYLLAKAGARFKCIPVESWLYGCGDWRRQSDGPGN